MRGSTLVGWRIQPRARRSRTNKQAVHNIASSHTRVADQDPVLGGWCTNIRRGVSKRTFRSLDHFAHWCVVRWLRKRYLGLSVHTLVRRYIPRWEIRDGQM